MVLVQDTSNKGILAENRIVYIFIRKSKSNVLKCRTDGNIRERKSETREIKQEIEEIWPNINF